MKNLKITDVRAVSGDASFLIDDGVTSVLYDTGFGFTGKEIADKVKMELGERKLDFVLLTHSHYDHVLGLPHVLKFYPDAKVIAGEYAEKIFKKPSAIALMRDLDRKFANTCGVKEYEDLADELRVDITVKDGDDVKCGDMTFKAVNLPGHTRCSVGFYLEENKLLLATETLGVYFGNNTYLPFFLVGFEMTLDSFKKAKDLKAERILLPHYGVVEKDEAKAYLENSERVARETVDIIKDLLLKGKSSEEILLHLKEKYYTSTVVPTYPIDAFNLNTSIIIEVVKRELM